MQPEPWRFFCIVQTRNQAPLLAESGLAERTHDALQQTVLAHHGQLWGYVILPDSVQFVIEVASEQTYHRCIEAFKATSETVLRDIIQAEFEQWLDAITFYHPSWPQPLYLVWQSGYQTQLLTSVYALSNKIADLVNKPVELGLVTHPAEWVYSSYVDNDGP